MNLSVVSQIARARIQKTIVFAESVREVQYAGASDRKVSLSWAPGKHLCLAVDSNNRILGRAVA
jgi:hypothetical protein